MTTTTGKKQNEWHSAEELDALLVQRRRRDFQVTVTPARGVLALDAGHVMVHLKVHGRDWVSVDLLPFEAKGLIEALRGALK